MVWTTTRETTRKPPTMARNRLTETNRNNKGNAYQSMKGKTQYKTIDNQVYEAKENDSITFIPRSKEARKRQLQALVFRLLQDRWMKVTKARATLERQGIKELIESI